MKSQIPLQFTSAPGRAAGSAADVPTRLENLIAAARRNEAALRRFQALELDFMGADGIEELLSLLLKQAPQVMQWDAVTLLLHDPHHELRQLVSDALTPPGPGYKLQWVEQERHLSSLFCAGETSPRLGVYNAARHIGLFEPHATPPASVALLPLRRSRRWLGSYNIGSHDPARFHHSLATDFLQHLAAVVSICLETALHREQLRRLGLTDALTAVGNRRYFDQRLHEEIARAQRTSASLGCLLIDVDHFKLINDRHGHAAGDEVLQAVAQRIRSELRGADVLARYGGEEFAVLLPQADRARAMEVAERIRRCIAASPFSSALAPTSLSLSVSVGVATYRGDKTGTTDIGAMLLKDADAALYRAKHDGRNRVVVAG